MAFGKKGKPVMNGSAPLASAGPAVTLSFASPQDQQAWEQMHREAGRREGVTFVRLRVHSKTLRDWMELHRRLSSVDPFADGSGPAPFAILLDEWIAAESLGDAPKVAPMPTERVQQEQADMANTGRAATEEELPATGTIRWAGGKLPE